MAAPLPERPAPPTDSRRGVAARGMALAAAGIAALGFGLWLGLREPAPPAAVSSPPPSLAQTPSVTSPAAPAPSVPAPLAEAPVAQAPVVQAPAVPPASIPAAPSAAPPPATAAAPGSGVARSPGTAAPQLPAPTAAVPTPTGPIPTGPTPTAPTASLPSPAVAPVPATPPQTSSAPSSPPAPAVAPVPPSFDIVRVSPGGGTVMAGRAMPGAVVILRADGREIGRTRADAQGQWVLADAAPLPPGVHEITVAMLDAAGREVAGVGAVQAAVAARAAPLPAATASAPPAPAPPIVVMTTPQGAPVLLQGPVRQGASRLGLDIVDYDAAGEIRFAGTAPPGNVVRLYIDDAHVGDAEAGADGRWALVPSARVAEGEHRLRLDQMDRSGRVARRVEQPFQRAAVVAQESGTQRVVVQPRQNLWRIARRAYGQGVRYTEIFAANRDVISDPDRIYPGQVFTIPAAAPPPAAGASTPSSSSRSR